MRASEFVQINKPSNQPLSAKALETKRLLEKSGFFKALAEGQRLGETTAQTLEKIAKRKPATQNGIPSGMAETDRLLEVIISEWLESSELVAEKDARIKDLEEKIALLQSRISALEKVLLAPSKSS